MPEAGDMLCNCFRCSLSYFSNTKEYVRNQNKGIILPLLYYSAKCDYECRRYVGLCLALNMAEVVGTVVGVVVDYAFGQLR